MLARTIPRGGSAEWSSQRDAQLMDLAVVDECDLQWRVLHRDAVERGVGDATAHAPRIFDHNLVCRGAVSEQDLETRPCSRHAGIEVKRFPLQAQSENPFEACPVHPTCRARIPSPSAPPDMRGCRIDIGANNIWLDLIAVN